MDKENICVIGSDGNFGRALSQRFNLEGIPFSDEEKGYQMVASFLEKNPKGILVIAVAADFQVSVHKRIFDVIKGMQNSSVTIVNINSVQDQVPMELDHRGKVIPKGTNLVGVHPHHCHSIMENEEMSKKWLLAYVKNQERDKETARTRLFSRKLNAFFKEQGISDIELFNFDVAASKLPTFRNGAELHDKLTAYSQALVHMLRILVDDDKLFFESFVKLSVGKELSEAIVHQNPYAYKGIFEILKSKCPSKEDPDFIEKLKTLTLKIIDEYEKRFESVPQEIIEAAKTPKFEELILKLKEEKAAI